MAKMTESHRELLGATLPLLGEFLRAAVTASSIARVVCGEGHRDKY